MRRSIAVAMTLATLLAACSDNSSTPPRDLSVAGGIARSRVASIDNYIVQLFPRGIETATGARWDRIDVELGTWDANSNTWTGTYADQGRKHTLDLIKFIQLKSGDIEASGLATGETRNQAAARLIAAMTAYVLGGPGATVPAPGADLVVTVVPAGTAATIVTPSNHAGVSIPAGATNEDRVIVVSQTSAAGFGDRCSGPLAYTGCQFPLFYQFESLPHLKLNTAAHFAVCIDFSSANGPTQAEHDRARLAHDLPANAADYTPGATQIQGIELLPLSATQQGFLTCESPAPPPVIGFKGLVKRGLFELAELASKVISPKPLYAYDQGPEHDSFFFSNFNAVDPQQGETGPTTLLYGVNAADDGLSTINPTTGVETFIARLSPDQNQYMTPVALAVDPATNAIYVWNNSPKAELLVVDRCSGTATSVNPDAADGPGAGSLAISPTTGQMYLLDTQVFTVDKNTGATTLVGSTGGVRLAGADFDANGVLYGANIEGTALYTVNTATGAATQVATLNPAVGTLGSIVFAPDGSLLGTAFGDANTLFNIDKANGTVSNVRNITGGFAPQGLGFAGACQIQ